MVSVLTDDIQPLSPSYDVAAPNFLEDAILLPFVALFDIRGRGDLGGGIGDRCLEG